MQKNNRRTKKNSIKKKDLINAFEIFDEKKTGKCSSKE
jgi:Ca2+-binding EF-hand superfamily protein